MFLLPRVPPAFNTQRRYVTIILYQKARINEFKFVYYSIKIFSILQNLKNFSILHIYKLRISVITTSSYVVQE